MTAVELAHDKSEARHLHLAKKDTNKVFSIGFKTNPPDLTGLPHILEHTTLCGSKQYPVKDPFFSMQTRSLANFMNAMTGLDYTFYPFATTNETDYKNLQKVYLDAVFHPLLRESDFRQEGWRLEKEVPGDDESSLIFKGVVYNEMKGMMSDPSYIFNEKFLRSIYPSLQSSGGDPAFITDLRYEDLVEFQKTRYHPSNSFTLSYGDMELGEILSSVNDTIESFSKEQSSHAVLQPIDIHENKTIVAKGPVDPMFDQSKQHKYSLSWIVGDSGDLKEMVVWKVLGLLLTYGHSSPLHKVLIDGGIGTDFSPNTGFQDLPGKTIFSVGLQGCSEESLEQFKEAINGVFLDIAENGLPREQVEAIINQVELSQKEVDSNFGMSMVYKVFPRVFNTNSIIESLDDEKLLNTFKQEYENNRRLFQDAVQNILLSQPHFEFVMTPDAEFEAASAEEEQVRLAKKIEECNGAPEEVPVTDKGDEEVLPTLTSEDLSSQEPSIEVQKHQGNTIFVRETNTRGLIYTSITKDMSHLPIELLPVMSLFATALSNVGTKSHTAAELENLIRLHTGGVDASISTMGHAQAPFESSSLKLNLSGTSVEEKSKYLFDFFQQYLLEANFDNVEKLSQLIQSSASNAMADLSHSGHSYAVRHASAAVTPKKRLDELLNGMEQVFHIKMLAEKSPEQLGDFIMPKLKKIADIASSRSSWISGVTYSPSPDTLSANVGHFNNFLSTLKQQDSPDVHNLNKLNPLHATQSYFKMPFGVSYVGGALKGAAYDHKDSAALKILSSLLTHKHLHPEIREKGGAYGGGAIYSSLDGLFQLYSYRDPHPSNTISVVKSCGDWVLGTQFTDRDLLAAKLYVFQALETPIAPKAEIAYEYLYGLTNEMRQKKREDLLRVTLDDVKRVAEKYLINGSLSLSVLGQDPKGDFTEQKGWTINEV
ncbi:presequence protease, mitochondrial [Trichomonascus vanleenenianus]|uniref:pitrilysin family metalloprotease n=1 Tax=Trichomonascus vanleenenianus TaxID=2268995 RepID=UPI003ECB3F7F